ncbi:aminotransferase class IV [Muricauda sp. 334s03]|uniref:Aminotransferase class IV n=1 Tax=Flagellimonas yonaguniensis TaxID=3031325 RepID=A0ABT5Y1Y2_9FLAO|nr:aminotransferase class IV [[Muricauda] yonaguniensis]MDF0717450.1 aminotransferase class IV [[Muricauda] yonaguniensis]
MLPKGNFPEKVYLNGKIVSVEDARISVFDRGFLFGDGIYEVMVQLENGIFHKKAHLDRLQENLIKIGIPYNVKEIDDQLETLLESSNLSNESCLIYMQVTRGVAPRKHSYPKGVPATVMMYALPYTLPPINPKHMKAILEPDFRWHRCDIKSISLLGNIMTNESAMEANTNEAALIRNGVITEGSHTNIFFVKNGTILTHPANEHILNGISRQIVFQLCKDLEIPVIEKPVAENEVIDMDEAFFTGTTTQVASIAQLGEHTFYGNDDVGKITRKLQEAFAELRMMDSTQSTL